MNISLLKDKNWSLLSIYRNILYGIAVISIIIYHYTSIFSYYPEQNRPVWGDMYFDFLGSIGVEVFLFLSGISLYFAWEKKSSITSFFARRLKRIIIPYFLVSIIFFAVENAFITQGSVYNFFKDVFFITFFTNGQNRFWYVFVILMLYACYPILHHFMFKKKENSFLRMIILQIICFSIIYLMQDTKLFSHIQIGLTRIPIFILGCFYGKKVYNHSKITIFEFLAAMLGIVLKFFTAKLSLNLIIIRYIAVIFGFSFCILLSVLINFILNKFPKQKKGLLSLVGNRSLEFYIIHVALIKLFIDFNICAIKPKNYFFLVVITIATSFILYTFSPKILTLFKSITIDQKTCAFIVFFSTLFIKTILNLDLSILTVPSDEFNSVSIAAQIMGYPWENAISINGYYGYTAVFSYLPVFGIKFLTQNSYLLYQALLFVNSLMCAAYTLVVYKVLLLIGKNRYSPVQYMILSLIAGFIPQLFGVNQLTQNESTYALNHMLALYMILLYMTNTKTIKKILYSMGCALFCVLSLAGNNRGMVVIIAVCISLPLVYLFCKKWILNPLVFSITLAIALSIHYNVLYPFFLGFYSENPYNTDAGLIFMRIPRILTNWEDLKACLTAAIGWSYSFIISTYGIGILAIGILLLFWFNLVIKRTDIIPEESTINIFLSLWFVGTTALCIVSFLDSFQGILQFNTAIPPNKERVDKLFYFRYYIALAPFSVSYCLMLQEKYEYYKQKLYVSLIKIILGVIILGFHGYVLIKVHALSYAPSSTNLIGLFLGNWTENYKYGTVSGARFLICTFIAIIALVTLYLSMKKNWYKQWLSAFLVIEIISCIVYSGFYMGPRTKVWKNYTDQQLIAEVHNSSIEEIYVVNKGVAFLYQFALPSVAIHTEYSGQEHIICETNTELPDLFRSYDVIFSTGKTSLWKMKSK